MNILMIAVVPYFTDHHRGANTAYNGVELFRKEYSDFYTPSFNLCYTSEKIVETLRYGRL